MVYAIVFALLGFVFPPFWILAIIFLVASLFVDITKILLWIIAAPFRLLGFMFGSDEEEVVVKEKVVVEKEQSSKADQLHKLSELLEKELITQEEFDKEKAKILNPYEREA